MVSSSAELRVARINGRVYQASKLECRRQAGRPWGHHSDLLAWDALALAKNTVHSRLKQNPRTCQRRVFLDPEPPAVHVGRELECPRGLGHQGLQLLPVQRMHLLCRLFQARGAPGRRLSLLQVLCVACKRSLSRIHGGDMYCQSMLQGWDVGGSHPERSPAHINRIASSLAREALAAGFFRLCILQWRLLAHSLQLAPELLENFDLVELQLVGRALPSQQERCEEPVRALGQAGLFFSLTRAKENKELLVQIQTQRELLFQLRRILESLTRVKQPSLCWLDEPAFRAKGVVGLEVVGSGLADLVIVGTHTSGHQALCPARSQEYLRAAAREQWHIPAPLMQTGTLLTCLNYETSCPVAQSAALRRDSLRAM